MTIKERLIDIKQEEARNKLHVKKWKEEIAMAIQSEKQTSINMTWHDAKADPPKIPGDYMTFNGQEVCGMKVGNYQVLHWDTGWNVFADGSREYEVLRVTHWMPLPFPPEGYNEVAR